MALEGDLRLFRLPDVLQVISQQQKTGILTVQGEHEIIAVSFLRGEIVAADALHQNLEDGLGEILASQGVFQPEEFARLSANQRASGERLAEFLVSRGALGRDQLLEALRVQTYRLLLQVLRWRDGDFKFYTGDEVSFEEGFRPMAVEELLLRAVGDLMGEGTLAGALPHGFVAYERLPTGRPVRQIQAGGEPATGDPDVVWVSEDEATLLARIDGLRTADELARDTGLGEYKTLFGLFRLLQGGIVRPTGGQAPSGVPPRGERIELGDALAEAPLARIAARAAAVEAALARLPGIAAGVTAAAGLATALLVLFGWLGSPQRVLAPFPWQADRQAELVKQRRAGAAQRIDRGARAFFLLEGRYPDQLVELVDRALLPPRAIEPHSGTAFDYRAEAAAYSLAPIEGIVVRSDLLSTESIVGDLFLDPEMFADLRTDRSVPIVLLD